MIDEEPPSYLDEAPVIDAYPGFADTPEIHRLPALLTAYDESLRRLDPDQSREVARDPDLIYAVTANAGAGKTATMIARMLSYFFSGENAFKVVGISFTNKAAKEIRHRYSSFFEPHLSALQNHKLQRPFLGTLHSFSSYVLNHLFEVKYSSLTDTQDTRLVRDLPSRPEGSDTASIYKAIEGLFAACEVHLLVWPEFSVDGELLRIHDMTDPEIPLNKNRPPAFKEQYELTNWFSATASYRRMEGMGVDKDEKGQRQATLKFYAGIAHLSAADLVTVLTDYLSAKYSTKSLFFSDILYVPFLLMVQHKVLRAKVRYRFQRFLVDEAQDLSAMDWAVVAMVTGYPDTPRSGRVGRSLMVAGDSKQRLYGWRFAMSEALDKLDLYLDDSQVVFGRLTRNYRSDDALVHISNGFAEGFDRRHLNPSIPVVGRRPDPLRIEHFDTTADEDTWISQEIRRLHDKEGVPWGDITILARLRMDLEAIEMSLLSRRIPYRMRGNAKIAKSEAYGFVNALFGMAINPRDGLAASQVASSIKGIGKEGVRKVQSAMLSELKKDPRQTVEGVLGIFSDEKVFYLVSVLLRGVLPTLRENIEEIPLPEIIGQLREGLLDRIAWPDLLVPKPRVTMSLEWMLVAKIFDLVHSVYLSFLSEDEFQEMSYGQQTMEVVSALAGARDALDAEEDMSSSQSVQLSTIHGFKGGENVYIFGIHQSLMWLRRGQGQRALDDEKCCFYVQATRAKRRLYLTYSDMISTGPHSLTQGYPNNELLDYLTRFQKFKADQDARKKS